ncbi:MAG: TolC family protein [Gemmatimonadaceae bacterium]|nr:TolC family protein [Gemmatimonadaceae bacterium]
MTDSSGALVRCTYRRHVVGAVRGAVHCAVLGALALAVMGACEVRAQEGSRTLSLAQSIELAQRQSLQARAAESTRDAARRRDRAFTARRLPQLSLTGDIPAYNRAIIPVLQPDGSTEFKSQQQTDASLNLQMTQRLPFTGGSFFVSSALSRLEVNGTRELRNWSSTPLSLGLRQDILRPNSFKWDGREQDLRGEAAERQYLEAREDVAIGVTQAFFDLYTARLDLENATRNAAVNDTLYTLNKGRFEVGKIGENDLLQSELALLRARNSVDGARLTHDRAMAAFRLALNLPPDAPVNIAVTDVVPDLEADTLVAVQQALRNRALTMELELQDVQARRRINEARLNNGIGATLLASVGLNQTASDVNAAYRDLLNQQRFSLALQMPIVQWGARSNDIQAARADQDRVAATSRVAREQLVQDAHFAALQLSQSRRQLALSAKSDTVAAKRFEVAYNRYVIGRIDMDNLYLAQNEKNQALTQYLQSLRGFWLSYYRLRRVTLYDFTTGTVIR